MMKILSVKSDLLQYEVGKDGVREIKLTDQGNEKLSIYKITGTKGELITHAGLLIPHEVVEDSDAT